MVSKLHPGSENDVDFRRYLGFQRRMARGGICPRVVRVWISSQRQGAFPCPPTAEAHLKRLDQGIKSTLQRPHRDSVTVSVGCMEDVHFMPRWLHRRGSPQQAHGDQVGQVLVAFLTSQNPSLFDQDQASVRARDLA